MINKTSLLSELIDLIRSDIAEQRKSFDFARQTSIDAPGRMQSRYDTMGVEAAWVADGLAKSLNEKEMHIVRLQKIQINESPKNVCIGSIVVISSDDSSPQEHYFILPVASGYKLQAENLSITTLTPLTPLGKVLVGKEVGDEIEVKFPKPRSVVIEQIF